MLCHAVLFAEDAHLFFTTVRDNLMVRALLTTAPILPPDEPTEHLDAAEGRRKIAELPTVGGLFPAGRTVVVASPICRAQISVAPLSWRRVE